MGAPSAGGDAVLAAVAYATEHLLGGEGWADRLHEVLEHLGAAAGADRVSAFQNVRDPGGRLWMDLRAEWDAPGIRRVFDDPTNHLHPYAPDFARWIEVLSDGRIIHGAVSEFPAHERRVLAPEQVVSTIAVPVHARGEWWGFVAFDDCETERRWTDTDIDALRTLAGTLGAAVERERTEEERRFAEDRYRAMVEEGPAVTYVDGLDESASTIYISPQIEGLLGYSPHEWVADPELWPKLLHPDDRARALAENERHNETGEPFRLEYRMFHRDGRAIWVRDEATMVRDQNGVPRFSHGVIVDMSDRRHSEEQVAYQMYHDVLTGLPSRSMFEELLELAMSRAERHEGAVAVIVADIDDFRLVNDSLGRQVGDALLQQVAERLREATRETEVVARRGGDQFLLLLSDLETGLELDAAAVRAESAAQRLQEAFTPPFLIDGTELYVSLAQGISLFPQDADEASALMRNAEAAMHESKKAGSSSYTMSSLGASDSSAKLRFVTRLRKAVDAQRWVLHYQPIVELDTGRMRGVEALIRWAEPDGTIVPPSEFIPLAEELGLIESIGDWVVRELAYQATAWKELGIDLEVGFNLSPRQFWRPDLAERMLEQVHDAGIEPASVVVEITETSAMIDPDRAQEILWDLHRGGLRIAIDDFGTGYSSLSRLREMPVDILKIDRSFVSRVDEDRQAASIVAAFLELSSGLEMETLAEGIETDGELSFLRARGCSLGQGFLFSTPVPPEEIIALSLGGIPMGGRVATA